MKSNTDDICRNLKLHIQEKTNHSQIHPDTGIAVSVLHNDEIILKECFGSRNRSLSSPVTPETMFPVSSITKSITALAHLFLEEEGKLKLDQPINNCNVVLDLVDPIVSEKISTLDILCHRSGIPTHDLLWLLAPMNSQNMIKKLKHSSLIPDGFQKKFNYSNLLYGFLGDLFFQKTGRSLLSYAHENILEPIGMKDTTTDIERVKESENFALPYSGDIQLDPRDTKQILTAGGLYSNLNEMSLWLQLNLNKNKSPLKKLKPALFDRIFHRHTTIDTPNPLLLNGLEWLGQNSGYGLGWFLGTYLGHDAFYHPGLIDGHSIVLIGVPELKVGVTVLTNLNLSPLPGEIAHFILSSIFEDKIPKVSPTTIAEAPPSAPPTLRKSTKNDGSICGTYQDPVYGEIRVEESNGIVSIHFFEQSWPLDFEKCDFAHFSVGVFGIEIPMTAEFKIENETCTSVQIPLSLDLSVPPQQFLRVYPRA